MTNFSSFALPKQLLDTLTKLKFTTPTPIQEATIPLALAGKDILGSAQTGTGKTAAFGIPIIAKLLTNNTDGALIITPTRELALQVINALKDMLGNNSTVRTCLLIGGEPIQRQLMQLKRKPRLFVGTPGRINDHLKQKTLNLKSINNLVLDEMDRMLDMGFTIQIDSIIKHLAKERQTFLFSATVPSNIIKKANSYMKDPERVSVGDSSAPGENIKHNTIKVTEQNKYDQLLDELNNRNGSVIVFMKTKYSTEKMAKKLAGMEHKAVAIHGDLQHSKRERVIKAFRNKKYRILVATDIAARGLDIPHVEHVINHDLPQCPEDYLHRIGRTARAGATGEAICFISKQDTEKWNAIDRLMNPNSKKTAPNTRSGKSFKGKTSKLKKSFFNKNAPRKAKRTSSFNKKSKAS